MPRPSLRHYTKVGEESGFDILKRKKEKSNHPKYAYRGQKGRMTEDEWNEADNLTDIKILAKERYWAIFGPGVVSGYRFSSPPPEEEYRKVIIGKYLYRDKTIGLPRFMAKVIPRGIGNEGLRFFARETVVEGFTVSEVRKKIDEAIREYPEELRIHFPA